MVSWSEYNKSLKERGDLTIWFSPEGIATWLESESNSKNRGRPRKYSDLAIKTSYIIRQVFNLRLRQTEGFTKSILKMLEIELPVPDYTTISRRVRELSVDIISNQKPRGKINLILDNSGIKVLGEKEWINHKYHLRQRRVWRKLHIGVTDDGSIVAGEVTNLRVSDIATVPALLSQVSNQITTLIGDGVYYRKRMERYISENNNTKEARFIGPSKIIDKSKNQNYGNRLKVEETFSRYKRIIGNKFKAKDFQAQLKWSWLFRQNSSFVKAKNGSVQQIV